MDVIMSVRNIGFMGPTCVGNMRCKNTFWKKALDI